MLLESWFRVGLGLVGFFGGFSNCGFRVALLWFKLGSVGGLVGAWAWFTVA